MDEGPHNWVITVTTICGLNEDDWAMYMAYFLKNNVLPPEPFCTNIYEDKDLFMTDNDKYLLHKINDNISSYVLYAFRADFIEQMHSEYSHLRYPELLEVINGHDWWHTLKKNLKSYVKVCL